MPSVLSKIFITSMSACVGSVFANWTLNHNYYHHTVYNARKGCESQRPIERQTSKVIPSRCEQLKILESTNEFDVLIIGGGATGAGCALDAASRGLKTAMIEANDFSSGASSKSTKLIHGGVRYLQSAIMHFDSEQYKMVKEALKERAGLLEIAPHLTYPIAIMLPVYRWWQVPYFWMGLKMYDVVAGAKNIKSSYYLSKKDTLEVFPMLKAENLCGAIVYYDGQMDDARMGLSVALTAARYGATICNHVEAKELFKKKCPCGKKGVRGAKVIDHISGKEFFIKAKCVINATGPFCDTIRKMADENSLNICSPSSGAHIILPGYYSSPKMGLIDPSTSDGRIIFLLPWNKHTIVGTTDRPCELTHHPKATEAEIEFILQEIKNYLNCDVDVRRSDVLSAWSGIRPLVSDPSKKDTKTLARNHIIEVSPSQLITIAGGKWTTYRAMAEQTIDMAIDISDLEPNIAKSATASIKLVGADGWSPTMYIRLVQDFGFDFDVAHHLSYYYGEKAFTVAKMAVERDDVHSSEALRIHADFPIIAAEIRYGIQEYACTIIDIIARRLRLAFLNTTAAQEVLPTVADIMAAELKWSESKKQEEIQKAKEFLIEEMGHKIIVNENKCTRLSNEDIDKYTQQFQEMDKNKNGYVAIKDIRKDFENYEQLHEILNEIDTNMNGQIQLNDYLQIMSVIKIADTINERQSQFEEMKKQKRDIERLRHKISVERSGGGF